MKITLSFIILSIVLFSCEGNSKNKKKYKKGNLEFFETYSLREIEYDWKKADELVSILTSERDSVTLQSIHSERLNFLVQNQNQTNMGYVLIKNKSLVDSILNLKEIKSIFPDDLKFMWSAKTEKMFGEDMYTLYAVRIPGKRDQKMGGKDIKTVNRDTDLNSGSIIINLTMTERGADKWAEMTSDNVGNVIVITMDDIVYSAPRVNDAITGGMTQISGAFSLEEADELVGRIEAGIRK